MPSIPVLVLSYALLAFAVVALWIPVRPLAGTTTWLWGGALGAACAAGIAAGMLTWLAPVSLAVLAAICLAARDVKAAWIRRTWLWLAALVALALALHRVPGFSNPSLLAAAADRGGASPLGAHGNFDKTAVGAILMGILGYPIRSLAGWKAMLVKVWPVVIATPVIVLGLAMTLNYVKPDFKWFPYSGVFLVGNLLSACVAEEAFFRGLLLPRLTGIWSGHRLGTASALALTSVFFGAVHFGGGPVLIVLATIAGVLYGTAYLVTQRVEGAILTHFALNAVHFVAFSYPNLQS